MVPEHPFNLKSGTTDCHMEPLPLCVCNRELIGFEHFILPHLCQTFTSMYASSVAFVHEDHFYFMFSEFSH